MNERIKGYWPHEVALNNMLHTVSLPHEAAWEAIRSSQGWKESRLDESKVTDDPDSSTSPTNQPES